MIALEVTYNGRKVVLAGSELLEGGCISASLDVSDTTEDRVTLTVYGITKYREDQQQRVLYWKEKLPFSFGDEIKLKAIQVTEADPFEFETDPMTEE